MCKRHIQGLYCTYTKKYDPVVGERIFLKCSVKKCTKYNCYFFLEKKKPQLSEKRQEMCCATL